MPALARGHRCVKGAHELQRVFAAYCEVPTRVLASPSPSRPTLALALADPSPSPNPSPSQVPE